MLDVAGEGGAGGGGEGGACSFNFVHDNDCSFNADNFCDS